MPDTPSPAAPGSAGRPLTLLVTGAAGFLGSRVVELLSQTTDHRVLAVDVVQNPRSKEIDQLPNVQFQALDLRDADAMESVVAQAGAIVHLAAIRTQAAKVRPKDAHDVNVGTTYDLLTLATNHGVERFVFGSTNTLYGPYLDPEAPPCREDEPWVCRGINMYAATKLASEAYLEAFSGLGGPSYLALRIGPIYGPRVSPGSNGSMSVDVLQALDAGERPSLSWTADSIHSFVYVDDVAKAIIAALTAAQANMAINVVGAPVTTEAFVSRLIDLYGQNARDIEWRGERVRYQRVSQDRMREVLGFVPETTHDQGLRAVIDWHRGQQDT